MHHQKSSSTLDFAAASSFVASAIESVEVVGSSCLATHRLVKFTFVQRPLDIFVDRLVKPRPLPAKLPFGPINAAALAQETWGGAETAVAHAVAVRPGVEKSVMDGLLAQSYQAVVEAMVDYIALVTDSPLQDKGSRAQRPRLS